MNLTPFIDIDYSFGLIKGSAGFIIACLNFYKISNEQWSLDLAIAAGNKLLSTGHMENGSLSWRISSDQGLSGLSHGASGFAICFAQLFNVSKLENLV